MSVITRINGKVCRISDRVMTKILDRCYFCHHKFGFNKYGHPEMKHSVIVRNCMRFMCDDCQMTKPSRIR
jgi:hypothetical protein